jgi:hypothetical protein
MSKEPEDKIIEAVDNAEEVLESDVLLEDDFRARHSPNKPISSFNSPPIATYFTHLMAWLTPTSMLKGTGRHFGSTANPSRSF